MSKRNNHFYDFGPFRLEVLERRLRGKDAVLSLTPKAFEVLLLLVQNSGHVLKKEEFLEKVWSGSYVEEKNLADNISLLRKVLGDDPKSPSFIETVPRLGYRFIADVREVAEDGEQLVLRDTERATVVVEEEDATDTNPLRPLSPSRLLAPEKRGRRVALSFLGAAVVITLLTGYAMWRKTRAVRAPVANSIAVLPFKPLIAGTNDQALELGMTDALITKLSNIRQIVVRPTNSVLKYAAEEKDLRVIGSELSVDVVLDGRVQKLNDRIRLSVQLVRTADAVPIWAENFDEQFKDIFAMQDAISQRVSDALAFKLTGEERSRLAKRPTANTEAYRLYMLGRFFWNKRTKEDLLKAANYFQQAIDKDPRYALAYAGLADTYYILGWRNYRPREEAFTYARQSAQKALEIDEQLAEAHTPLARIKSVYDHDYAGAEKELRRALELNPSYATAHHWYSRLLLQTARIDESISEARRARELDPLSLIINNSLAEILYYARRYDESLQAYQRTRELDPNFNMSPVSVFFYLIYKRKGMFDKAIPEFARSLEPTVGPQKRMEIESALKTAYERANERGLRLKQIELLFKEAPQDENFPLHMFEAYAALGNKDQAFYWLNKAADAHHPGMDLIHVDPDMDTVSSDPRFAALVQRLNVQP